MFHPKFTFAVLFLSQTLLSAQNLVINGGFERLPEPGKLRTGALPCRFSMSPSVFNDNVPGWRSYYDQTPDLIVLDSTAICPEMPKPHRGNRMVGLILYHPFYDSQFATDYHEMIQGTLARPLEKGKTYKISFYTKTNDSLGVLHLRKVFGRPTNTRAVRCGNMGFWFSESPINQREIFMQSQMDLPIQPQVNIADIVEAGDWHKISISFTADKPYRYFLFGNFFFDAVTPINIPAEERQKMDEKSSTEANFWKKTKRIGYYCFDDFVIVEDKGTPESVESMLLQKKTYTFNAALLFDSGAASLKSEALPALRNLADVLKKNAALTIEIGGHTDNVGSDADNQRLSQARAEAVQSQLLLNGVPAAQLRARGYGESKPAGNNDTEAGRQQNRRVEVMPL